MKDEQNILIRNLFRKTTWLESLRSRFQITQILAMSFVVVIFIGSLLLWLPIANKGPHQPYLNHLFIATSAVCVTGLSPLTVADQYTVFGQTVMILMMEIGGLGLMSFVAAILTARKAKLSFSERELFVAASGSSDTRSLNTFISKIFKYTMIFQGLGILLLSLRFIPQFGMARGIFNAIFLGVSAFTNAGFDPLGAHSLLEYISDPLVSLTVIGLIIVGGLGFMVWFDLSSHLKHTKWKGLHNLRDHLSAHTRTVLFMTSILLVSGFGFFLILECTNNGTIGDVGLGTKILAAMFQSTTLRTAGFATVTIGNCHRATLLIMCIYMLIGGSPGGTAGGMKTTTVAVLAATLRHTIRNEHDQPHVFHRSIDMDQSLRAYALFFSYIGFLSVAIILLVITENHTSMIDLFFEAFSAIATVGLSTGITSGLSAGGKIIIIALMYSGRLGPLMVTELLRSKQERGKISRIKYPRAEIPLG